MYIFHKIQVNDNVERKRRGQKIGFDKNNNLELTSRDEGKWRGGNPKWQTETTPGQTKYTREQRSKILQLERTNVAHARD